MRNTSDILYINQAIVDTCVWSLWHQLQLCRSNRHQREERRHRMLMALGWYPCCVHFGKSLIKILWTSFCISNAYLPAWVDVKIQEDTAHHPAHGMLSRMLSSSSSTRLKSVSANRIWLQQCLPQPTSPNHSPPFQEATLGCSLQKDSHQFNQEWQSDRTAF